MFAPAKVYLSRQPVPLEDEYEFIHDGLEWNACGTCSGLIEARDWLALLERVTPSNIRADGGIPTVAAIRDMEQDLVEVYSLVFGTREVIGPVELRHIRLTEVATEIAVWQEREERRGRWAVP